MTPSELAPPLVSASRGGPDRPKTGLGNNWIGEEEKKLVLEVLDRKMLFRYGGSEVEAQGLMTNALERELCQQMGVKYALGVTSGTAALEVALAALGVGPGDEVIVPVWSWVSCFSSVVRLGALPRLAEFDKSLCLAPGEIRRLAGPRTKAVIIMHYQGVAADMEPLLKEARACGVRVLEDCAQSIGASYRGQKVGSMGDMGIYSFNYSKTISSGEGGAVVTNDAFLYERALRMHDLGFVRASHHLRFTPKLPAFCGAQYRMSELTAAVALAQLRKLEAIIAHCRHLRHRLMRKIGGLAQFKFRWLPDPAGDTAFETYFWLPTEELTEVFTGELEARNVNCDRMTGTYCHYARDYCIRGAAHVPHASPFGIFDDWPAQGYRAEDFPFAENLVHRLVALPVGVCYSEADVDYLSDCVIAIHRSLGL